MINEPDVRNRLGPFHALWREMGLIKRKVESLIDKMGAYRIVITNIQGDIILSTADLTILNDRITTFPLHAANYGDEVEPLPAGDNLTATSSNPEALAAAITTDENGNSFLQLTPAAGFPTQDEITITVSDSDGLAPYTRVVDLVGDSAPTQIVVDETMPAYAPLPPAPASASTTSTAATSTATAAPPAAS